MCYHNPHTKLQYKRIIDKIIIHYPLFLSNIKIIAINFLHRKKNFIEEYIVCKVQVSYLSILMVLFILLSTEEQLYEENCHYISNYIVKQMSG